jgi:hypothetical protein
LSTASSIAVWVGPSSVDVGGCVSPPPDEHRLTTAAVSPLAMTTASATSHRDRVGAAPVGGLSAEPAWMSLDVIDGLRHRFAATALAWLTIRP